MSDIYIEKLNEVHVKVYTEPHLIKELGELFTFQVPGYFYTPKYKLGVWDGKIRLLDRNGKIYYGLIGQIQQWAELNGHTVKIAFDDAADNVSLIEVKEWVESLKLPFKIAEHQLDPLIYGLRNRRMLLVSPTGSGKSLLAYLWSRWYYERIGAKTLIIEPTTTLIHQIAGDFKDYGSKIPLYKIHEGQSLNLPDEANIIISSWQSIYKQKSLWFSQFDTIIGDEAHQYKATSLKAIMENMLSTKRRFGMTGTLDGIPTNKLVLEGLFGPVRQYATTTDLIEKKFLANLIIKLIILSYPVDMRKKFSKAEYQEELDFLCSYIPRNKFIKNLALSLKGNTLLLFNYVDKHGKILYNMLSGQNRPVFLIHGKVPGEERNEIRKIINTHTEAILVASYGTFSTGINIPNIHNVIPASPFKSKIRNLQSMGRGLRVSSTKDTMTWLDIIDDMSWKGKNNTTLNHFEERLKIYTSEGFSYKRYKVKL